MVWTQVAPVDYTGMLRSVIFAQGNFYAVGGNGLTTTTQLVGGGASGTEWVKLKDMVTIDSGKLVNKLYWNGIGISLQALSQAGSVTTGRTTSPEGNWTNQTITLGASGDLQDIVYYAAINSSEACWLLVGSTGKVFCCYADWSGRVARTTTFTTSETVYCVNTIGVFLVVAGSNGKLFTATKVIPGITQSFTSRTSTFGSSSDILAMKLCNGQLFIVGEDGKMAYSASGLTWTAVADTSFGETVIRDIAYGDGKYVAVGDGGKTAVSDDGINWIQQTNTFEGTDIRSVSYGNGTFVAVGAGGKIAYWIP
ncbi:hypothetical protein DNK10_06080 [Pseudomonas daroniae]|nr:hypothetical protein DNK10_06080 [Pseudomonas daroniae]